MSNSEQFPQHKIITGEIMPDGHLKRGEMRTIDVEISRIKARIKSGPGNIDEIGPLEQAKEDGYKIILNLPLVNITGNVRKYGGYFVTSLAYSEFLNTLAQQVGITRFKIFANREYLFDTKEDADLFKQKLIEKQEKTELEFDIIEGGSNS